MSIATLDLAPPNLPPPPEFIGAAASRIYHGAPVRQLDLTAATEKVTAVRLRGLSYTHSLHATQQQLAPPSDVYD